MSPLMLSYIDNENEHKLHFCHMSSITENPSLPSGILFCFHLRYVLFFVLVEVEVKVKLSLCF